MFTKPYALLPALDSNFPALPSKSTFVLHTEPSYNSNHDSPPSRLSAASPDQDIQVEQYLFECDKILNSISHISVKQQLDKRHPLFETPQLLNRKSLADREILLNNSPTARRFIKTTPKRNVSDSKDKGGVRSDRLEERYSQMYPRKQKPIVLSPLMIVDSKKKDDSEKKTPRQKSLKYSKLQSISIQQPTDRPKSPPVPALQAKRQSLAVPVQKLELASLALPRNTIQDTPNEIQRYFDDLNNQSRLEIVKQRVKELYEIRNKTSISDEGIDKKRNLSSTEEDDVENRQFAAQPPAKLMRVMARGYKLFQKLKAIKR